MTTAGRLDACPDCKHQWQADQDLLCRREVAVQPHYCLARLGIDSAACATLPENETQLERFDDSVSSTGALRTGKLEKPTIPGVRKVSMALTTVGNQICGYPDRVACWHWRLVEA